MIFRTAILSFLLFVSDQSASVLAQDDADDEDIGTVIGIDLGTTYSCVGVLKNDRVEIIANDQGNRITPSYVAFTSGGDRLVGDAAKNQATINPENTVFDVKRLIGRQYSDKSVQADKKLVPYNIVSREGKPMIQVAVSETQKQTFAPEEISAMILQKMRQTAETFLGEKINDAVVTVPAYFNDAQRQATKDAGTIAGLTVRRIINEPTAAAIAFGIDKTGNEANVLVFDLGGGTFDVTLLVIDNGVFEVLATNGDTHLGGEDFDHRIMKYFMDKMKSQHGVDISKDKRALQKLRKESERVKRALSSQKQARLELEDLHEGFDLSESLSKAKFEELNNDLFKRTLGPVAKVLKDAELEKDEIDEIVLVGGSTRIPRVQELLQEYFGGKEPSKGVNPDEAVAYGAAVQGGILSGKELGEKTSMILLLDVTPLSLGIELDGGIMEVVIKRGTTIPAEKTTEVTTSEDNQVVLNIPVYEGERSMVKHNHFLGEFDLEGIPPAPREEAAVTIKFEIDANGILKVTAVDQTSGKKGGVTISAEKGRLSEGDIARMVDDAQKFAAEDRTAKERVEAKNELESYIYGLKNTLSDNTDKLSAEGKKDLMDMIDENIDWLEKNPEADKEDYEERQLMAGAVAKPIISEMYGGKSSKDDDEDDDDEDGAEEEL